MSRPTVTWHHGLVARWWAYFRTDAPELAHLRPLVAGAEPVLDLGCGAGRLLVPLAAEGVDVDGVDVSADMIGWCRAAADAAGVSPGLYRQPLHGLSLPRRYGLALACGVLGLGSSREEDARALARIREHLRPGGLLVVDNELPYANADVWARWPRGDRRAPAAPTGSVEPPEERRTGPDGCEYALAARLVHLDPLAQQERWEMHAWQWRDGVLVGEETSALTATVYFAHELVLLCERAGFGDVELRGPSGDRPPTADDETVLVLARR